MEAAYRRPGDLSPISVETKEFRNYNDGDSAFQSCFDRLRFTCTIPIVGLESVTSTSPARDQLIILFLEFQERRCRSLCRPCPKAEPVR